MAETESNVTVKERRCTSWRRFEKHIAELISLMDRTSCPGKEVFLRELIFFSTTRLEVREGERMDDSVHNGEELCISVLFDGEENRLTVEDSGAEMTDDYLGTRPKQGTKALISALKAGKDLSNIKLFDVGFFTVFAVADKVTIDSTHSGRTVLYTWESSATEGGLSVKCTPSKLDP
ncbi:Heat shock protein HSP 90-alpha [Holothuria leucospilota]|uniref:Heat shock protein HSP 90-alpha n=1 Tax=Holothuria leucospilota TaxID=206669 RepID=A0A9Q1HH90_HOLLE|nr:Heat shock protein HSP 90-alpha [Holothuria leucospilota]